MKIYELGLRPCLIENAELEKQRGLEMIKNDERQRDLGMIKKIETNIAQAKNRKRRKKKLKTV